MNSDHDNPTPRELLIFVLLWVVFCPLLGYIAMKRPGAMLPVGVFTLACALLAMALDRETPVRRQLQSLTIPAMLGALWLIGGRGESGSPWVLWIMAGVGAVGTGAMLASRRLALAVHRYWTDAAKPIGWTVSMALLGVVFFLVFTPLGLILRAFGYDPMQRRFDKGRPSYWSEHAPPPEPRRYFRQY
ncbi:MAG: hypothetical protein H6814_03865 [Phycisphaeraceae bacterium]|nr:hypothetical protein [Phycisphaeraceae bacterium]